LNNLDISTLVSAQNRTTQAVRAIAVFILYSALFNLIGGVIIGLAYGAGVSSYDGLASAAGGIVLGAVVIVVGYLVALFKALSELGKSHVGKEHSDREFERYSDEISASSTKKATKVSGGIACKSCGESNAAGTFRCKKCDGLI